MMRICPVGSRVHLAGHTGVGVGEDLKTLVLPSCHCDPLATGLVSAFDGCSLLQVQHDGAIINLTRGRGRDVRRV